MIKRAAERFGGILHKAKGHLASAYQFGKKIASGADTAHRFSKTLLDIMKPHIGQRGQGIAQAIGAYENLRSQVQQKHQQVTDVAGQIQKRALPQLAF